MLAKNMFAMYRISYSCNLALEYCLTLAWLIARFSLAYCICFLFSLNSAFYPFRPPSQIMERIKFYSQLGRYGCIWSIWVWKYLYMHYANNYAQCDLELRNGCRFKRLSFLLIGVTCIIWLQLVPPWQPYHSSKTHCRGVYICVSNMYIYKTIGLLRKLEHSTILVYIVYRLCL